MANANRLLKIPIFTTILILASAITESQAYSTTVPAPPPPGQEKLTHLHFYLHDTISGHNPTAVKVADAGAVTNSSGTSFGLVAVIDDPLTEGPDISSNPVGRAQGMYASADQQESGLLMVINFLFTEGEFNGSYVSLLGRNPILSPVREMPIVGGRGAFRFARGYATAKTYTFDRQSGDAVVEYDVYVRHY